MNKQDKEDIKMPYSMRLKSPKQDAGKRKPRIVTVKPLVESTRSKEKPSVELNETKPLVEPMKSEVKPLVEPIKNVT